MTAAHNRAARRELKAARAFKTQRVLHRERSVSAPDALPVRLPEGRIPPGEVLQIEVKTRKALPKLLTDALAQARRYAPSAIPVAILSATGGEDIACLPLRDLARLLNLQPSSGRQLALLSRNG